MSTIQTKVMASVAVIKATRMLTSFTALKFYVLILSVWGIGRLVWVSKVFENFSSVAQEASITRLSEYILSAVGQTDLLVQAMLFISLLAIGSLFADAISPARTRLAA